jgi:transcriptional repressor NrdR
MTVVIKRNGKREQFDQDKLRRAIAAAANEADVPPDRCEALAGEVIANLAGELAGRAEVRAIELRELVLSRLDRLEPRVARSWRDYDRESKGLS